jgi:uncharacterized membrane protein YedE/YeeE
MDNFTPFASTLGGVLLGLSASMMLLLHGRITGISGIFSGILERRAGDMLWRVLFVLGLVAGGTVFAVAAPESVTDTLGRTPIFIVLAGLLVGFGTRLGSGCTSGHGICGLTRFSPRSLVAVVTFMTTGAITAYVVNHVILGGAA